jgi:hypothetical protein
MNFIAQQKKTILHRKNILWVKPKRSLVAVNAKTGFLVE